MIPHNQTKYLILLITLAFQLPLESFGKGVSVFPMGGPERPSFITIAGRVKSVGRGLFHWIIPKKIRPYIRANAQVSISSPFSKTKQVLGRLNKGEISFRFPHKDINKMTLKGKVPIQNLSLFKVPLKALISPTGQGLFLQKVVQNKVSRIPVTLFKFNSEEVWVSGVLKKNDQIIIEGNQNLYVGETVEVLYE